VREAGPLKFEPLIKYFTHVLGETPVVVEDATTATPSSSTSTAQAKAAKKSAAAKDAEAKRREMEAKWQEEERRDRVRREKTEAERLARVFEDQERLAEGEFDDPSPVDEDVKVVHVAHGTPEDPVQAEIEKVLHELEAVAESAAAGVKGEGHVHADDQSADTPLQAASEDFEHGESAANAGEEVDAGYSATTPLEKEAEEVEEVSHAGDLHDAHARDEL
jgi:hypothetical protein